MNGNGRILIERFLKWNIILNAGLSKGRRKLPIMSLSSAANRTCRDFLETKEDVVVVVQRILAGNESRFEMFSFQKHNAVVKLRSQLYCGYFVICNIDTLRSAGWLLCRYALNSGCTLEKSLCSFSTIQGGKSRLEEHTKTTGVALQH